MIFIDINDFKTVNDSLGHAAGDELLVAVARRLRDCVRPSDTVARLGGDEFAIMLDRPDSEQEAIEVTERIDRHLAERFSISGQNISVHASAGIATGSGAQVSAEELIRNADLAMYRAKYESKDRYELFESGMELPVKKRHRLKVRLTRRGQGRLVRRPLPADRGAPETGRVAACEALCAGPTARVAVSRPRRSCRSPRRPERSWRSGARCCSEACRDAQTWEWNGGVRRRST